MLCVCVCVCVRACDSMCVSVLAFLVSLSVCACVCTCVCVCEKFMHASKRVNSFFLSSSFRQSFTKAELSLCDPGALCCPVTGRCGPCVPDQIATIRLDE